MDRQAQGQEGKNRLGTAGANANANRGGASTSGTSSSSSNRSTQSSSSSGNLTDEVKQQAQKLTDTAQQQAQQQFQSGKQATTQGLQSVSGALHQAADQLRKNNQDTMATFADEAATQVDQLSGHLQQESLHRVIDQVEGFARSQPYLFIGGAFALGALAARFLKASRPQSASWGRGQQQYMGRYGYGYGNQSYGPLDYPGVHYAGRQPYPAGYGSTGTTFGSTNVGTGVPTGDTGGYFGGTETGTGFGTGFNRGTVTTGSGVSHQTSGDDMGQYPNIVSPEGGASSRLAGETERQDRENRETGHATE